MYMLQHLEGIIKQYEPKQQEVLRHYAIKMNKAARIGDYGNYMTYGLVFTSLIQTYWATNQIKKVTG